MSFDDPIYLDRASLELLMDDTDQHRICWMHHDVLSNPKIGRMFDQYAGGGTPIRENWTTTAWVAASQQGNSCYLLFKWYSDFYAPPQRGDLYLLERDQGLDGEVRIRQLNMDFQKKMDERGQAWCRSLLGRVSKNASVYFGETDFESTVISRILRVAEDHPGRELEAFDWYFGNRPDGEKAQQCATLSAYFHSVQGVEEIIYNIIVTDGGVNPVHHMHTGELLDILNRFSTETEGKHLHDMAVLFSRLSETFQSYPVLAPSLGRGVGRSIIQFSQSGKLRWMRLGGRRLLRDLYWRVAPRQVWDAFFRWRGEAFYTVVRRPLVNGMPRGVYILTRFEDQTGKDVTDLFWLESVSSGRIHLCAGEFFEELMDELLPGDQRIVAMSGMRWHEGDYLDRVMARLKEQFDKASRGRF